MSSLSQRLRQLQIPATTTVEELDHLTLADLDSEVVAFGQKHAGKMFSETWGDQEWVQFMINRYQKSTKESHRRYLKWVELKVESMEQGQMVVPPGTQRGCGRAGAKAKPMAKSLATPSNTSSLDGELEWDMEPEMLAHMTMGQTPYYQQEEMTALQARMLNLENALTRVIRHMEDQALQEKVNVSEGTL